MACGHFVLAKRVMIELYQRILIIQVYKGILFFEARTILSLAIKHIINAQIPVLLLQKYEIIKDF